MDPAMKKSALVTFGVIMSALILCACEDRCCVDANGNVVDDHKCKEEEKARASGGHVGGGHYWYYSGTHGGVGTRARGGSFTPGVSRGGFGHLAGLHASGHS
jgi:hypothetical protein